jgi:hypothetical protein
MCPLFQTRKITPTETGDDMSLQRERPPPHAWRKTWELVRIRGGALFRSIHLLVVDPATWLTYLVSLQEPRKDDT